ncbi:hypothetical protein GCM10023093_10100 [Nemorincola caseinilytica]|uniref:DUF4199 domain-containing protein n=1 Tax=Nemorincola caseinilytica TaxID=2054315 RepID=A0ABP8N7V8_9BACT
MANITSSEPLSTAARNKMAMMNGLVLGVIYIIIGTVLNMTANALFLYMLLKGIGYLVYLVILGFMLANVRKANGGYIELREVFGAAFVIVLVAGTLSFAYNYLYVYVIDPGFTDKVKNATLAAMEKAKLPDEQIDKALNDIEKSRKFNLQNTIMSYMGGLLLDSFLGLIVSLIIKKPRPVFDNLQ